MKLLIRLIRNENMKLYKQKMSWIMITILISIISLTLIVTLKTESKQPANWKDSLLSRNLVLEEQLSAKDIPEDYKINTIQKEIQLNNYRLENNISPLYKNSALGFVQTTIGYTGVITLFIIIIASSIVSQEYSWGTIKLLLMRPVHRWKFLLAKFVAVIVNAFYLFILLFVLSLLVGILVFGLETTTLRYVYTINGDMKDVFIFTHFLQYFGSKFIGLVMIASFAFMISTIFKRNTLAVALSIFIQFAGSLTSSVLNIMDKDISKYIFFTNTNLYQYVEGTTPEGLTLMFSIIVLFVYFILFKLIAFLLFEKRDIVT
jgi:ABC-2 type transport system permease protein